MSMILTLRNSANTDISAVVNRPIRGELRKYAKTYFELEDLLRIFEVTFTEWLLHDKKQVFKIYVNWLDVEDHVSSKNRQTAYEKSVKLAVSIIRRALEEYPEGPIGRTKLGNLPPRKERIKLPHLG